MITSRVGWVRACEKAGVPHNSSRRDNYRKRWTDLDLLVFVRSFFHERIRAGESFSSLHYEQFATGRLNWPSGPTLRKQLVDSLGGWAAIFDTAISLDEEQVADNMLWNLTQDLDDPLHGDRIAYDAGCRCSRCASGKRPAAGPRVRRQPTDKQRQQRILAALESDPDDPRHGTMDGVGEGCRCPRCEAAERVDRYRRSQQPSLDLNGNPDDPRHGTMDGVGEGCRCPRCEAAERVDRYRRERGG